MRDLPVLRRSLAESWRSSLGWSVGVAATLLLYLPLYPSIGGNGQLQQIIDSLPPELVKTLGYEDIASGPGYAQSTFYGLMGFVLLVIAATSWGSGAIGGAEESGRLELTLAHGVGRVQYAVESSVAVLLKVLWLGVVSAILVTVLDGPSQLGIDGGHIIAASAALCGLAFVSAAAALLLGAATGRRIVATAAGAGIAVVGYAANAVGTQVGDLGWLRNLSPYAWAYRGTPLTDGFDVGGLALLWGLGLFCCVGAAVFLRGRDITG